MVLPAAAKNLSIARQAGTIRARVSEPHQSLQRTVAIQLCHAQDQSVRGITILLSRYNAQRLSGPGYSGTQDLVLPGIRVRTSSVLEYRCRHHSLSRVCTWAADAVISCTAAGAGPCPMLGRAVHGAAAPVLAVACRCVCVRRGLPHLEAAALALTRRGHGASRGGLPTRARRERDSTVV